MTLLLITTLYQIQKDYCKKEFLKYLKINNILQI